MAGGVGDAFDGIVDDGVADGVVDGGADGVVDGGVSDDGAGGFLTASLNEQPTKPHIHTHTKTNAIDFFIPHTPVKISFVKPILL